MKDSSISLAGRVRRRLLVGAVILLAALAVSAWLARAAEVVSAVAG
jgi:hypothetical protein